MKNINRTLEYRNSEWKNNSYIPKWVNIENVGLDQFFTKQDIAILYFEQLINFLKKKGIKIKDCIFIEPSAGAGSFYNLLPKDSRIGLDIHPLSDEIILQDFLSWNLPDKYNKKIKVFIGNPPFGYRGWLALSFMNKAANYADYVGFILPMSFQSEGKGSPKYRVKNLKLIHSETIPKNSFVNPKGKIEKVNALWQIWEKGENIKPKKYNLNEIIDIFTVDLRKERLCGKEKMDNADFFIQRTFYNTPPTPVKDFNEVRYVCGYGIIIKKNKEKIYKILHNVDWTKYSNLAAHNCRHISMYHIEKVLIENKIIENEL